MSKKKVSSPVDPVLPVIPAPPEELSHPPSHAPEVPETPPPAFKSAPEGDTTPPDMREDASDLVLVELHEKVILNGQVFEKGKARLPKESYDCWKHAVKKG